MISYELAKQLKDAGFPQKESHFISKFTAEDAKKMKKDLEIGIPIIIPNDDPFIPTLSELIEVCGYVRLEYFPDGKSFANCCDRKDHEQIGQSPEIAVANLYLALHKK